jgi:cyclophilin family peptidyl-prolyl cis-trans isomerase
MIINQSNKSIGCPNAKDPNSDKAGTGGPEPGTPFKGCDGQSYKRNAGGSIPDEVGKDHQRITNAPGTLSMANTGSPESGGMCHNNLFQNDNYCVC